MKRHLIPRSRSHPYWLPGPQREHYLPEEVYFHPDTLKRAKLAAAENQVASQMGSRQFSLRAALVTTRTMARWAERYRMRLSAVKPTVSPKQLQKQLRLARQGEPAPFEKITRTKEGALPVGLAEREALIDGFFEEFERHQVSLGQAEVSLYLGEQILLEQSDGIPGALAASTKEFAQLQDAWEGAGLPRDLYYPVRDERMVIEPVEKYGGVVRTCLYYSPRQWADRLQVRDAPLPTPSEEERLGTFIAACERFAQAVGLYIAELSELGQQIEQQKIQRLRAVFHEIHLTALRAREAWLSSADH